MNEQDQIYIDSVQEQIDHGMYHDLFVGRSDLTFLDIGANVGMVSIYASPYCKRIVAVEPSPQTFEKLVKNTHIYQMIECVQVALAPIDGFVPFYVNDINFTASSTVNTYGKQIMVEGNMLSTILAKTKLTHVDICKCDTEGAEGESLNHWQIDQAKDIVKTWFIEFHNCPLTDWQHKLGTTVGNFARCGYNHMKVDGMALWVSR